MGDAEVAGDTVEVVEVQDEFATGGKVLFVGDAEGFGSAEHLQTGDCFFVHFVSLTF
jgi:hypothetical protein